MTWRHSHGMPTDEQRLRRKRMGERLRQARGDRTGGDVAKAVAERLHHQETVSQSMISNYELGKAEPSPAKRRALEDVLGLPRGILSRDLGLVSDSEPAEEELTTADLVDQAREAVERLAARVAYLERQGSSGGRAGRRARTGG